MAHAATLKDIVTATGIPLNTVSRILAGRITRISPRTQARIDAVQKAANALGYRPHLAARTMRSGRHGSIALLSGTDRRGSFLPIELMDGIQDGLDAAGLSLTLVRLTEDELDDPQHLPAALRSRSCDGVLINHLIRLPETMRDRISSTTTPAIWINGDPKHIGVRPDDRAAGRLAAEQLLSAGHRRIAFAAGFPLAGMRHTSAPERLAGAREACRRRADFSCIAPTSPLPDRHTAAYWDGVIAQRGQRPTGIVCYGASDALAIACAAMRAGIQVPADLSIVAISEMSSFRAFPFDLSTAMLPWRQIGAMAVSSLLEIMDGRQPRPLALPPSLHAGATIAPSSQR